jgi:hypothetical protein
MTLPMFIKRLFINSNSLSAVDCCREDLLLYERCVARLRQGSTLSELYTDVGLAWFVSQNLLTLQRIERLEREFKDSLISESLMQSDE